MNLKHGNSARTDRETELIQRLRSRPDLWERFEAILALTEVEGGGHCTREAGWGRASRIHVAADGAEWITLQSRERLESDTVPDEAAPVRAAWRYLGNRCDALAQLRVLRANKQSDAGWSPQKTVPTLHHN